VVTVVGIHRPGNASGSTVSLPLAWDSLAAGLARSVHPHFQAQSPGGVELEHLLRTISLPVPFVRTNRSMPLLRRVF